MTTEWNGDAAMASIRKEAAVGIMAAAIYFENALRQRVGKANPPPYVNSSKEGEYPRLRTGAGQRALTHQPTTVADVMRTGSVKVGFVEGDHHLLYLEFNKRRLGLVQTLADLGPKLSTLATAGFRS